MSPSIIVVLHRERSCPGLIGRKLQARGYHLDLRRPALGDPLPADLSAYAGAVVLGGPMSANDDVPFIRREIDWIGEVLKAELPYLGICLGAQLLARQLGARVSPHPQGHAEIGFHPIRPTAAGRALLTAPLHVYQWHNEGFALPSGATLLARGDLFENQLFSYGEQAFGLQFHPEVTYQILRRWLTEDRTGSKAACVQSGVHQHMLRLVHGPELARWLDRFLTQWLARQPLSRPARPIRTTGAQALG